MIEERIEMWKQNLVQQGVLQGIQQGVLQGIQQGEYAGILKDKLEGLHQGEQRSNAIITTFLNEAFWGITARSGDAN